MSNYRVSKKWLQQGDFNSFVAPPINFNYSQCEYCFERIVFHLAVMKTCWWVERRKPDNISPHLFQFRKETCTTGTSGLWGREASAGVWLSAARWLRGQLWSAAAFGSCSTIAAAINKQLWKLLARAPALFKTLQWPQWPSPDSLHEVWTDFESQAGNEIQNKLDENEDKVAARCFIRPSGPDVLLEDLEERFNLKKKQNRFWLF